MVCGMKAVLVLASAGSASALVAGGAHTGAHKGFLANNDGMRPDVVAATLAKVEDEWVAQASAFVECSASNEAGMHCSIPGKAFAKSCGTIVSAVVQASEGDRAHVVEYMGDVCKEKALEGWHSTRCQSLAMLLRKGLGADNYANRESFDSSSICTGLWQTVAAEEKAALAQKHAEGEKAEAERVKAEEAEKKRRHAEEDARVAEAGKRAEEAAEAEKEAAAAAQVAEEAAAKQIRQVAIRALAKVAAASPSSAANATAANATAQAPVSVAAEKANATVQAVVAAPALAAAPAQAAAPANVTQASAVVALSAQANATEAALPLTEANATEVQSATKVAAAPKK